MVGGDETIRGAQTLKYMRDSFLIQCKMQALSGNTTHDPGPIGLLHATQPTADQTSAHNPSTQQPTQSLEITQINCVAIKVLKTQYYKLSTEKHARCMVQR